MNSETLALDELQEIIIPDEIITHIIVCYKCSFSHTVKVIKNQMLVSFDCINCNETIVEYTWQNN